jgi:hypothetical protein
MKNARKAVTTWLPSTSADRIHNQKMPGTRRWREIISNLLIFPRVGERGRKKRFEKAAVVNINYA